MRSFVLPVLAGLALAACAKSPAGTKGGYWQLAGEDNLRLCADSLRRPGPGRCDARIPDGRLLVEGDSTGQPVAFVRYWLGTGETTRLRFTSMRDSLTKRLGAPKCMGPVLVWRKDGQDLVLARRGTEVAGHGAGTPSWAVIVGVGPEQPHSAGAACPADPS